MRFSVVLQYFNRGGSPVSTTQNIGCPIHYDTIEDGQNKKNLIFYSLILAQIVERFNSIKRRTYDCGAIILGHVVESFNCT